jgi:hypothetical protein
VSWVRAKPDSSRSSFRRYLDEVFMYAGSASLARDTEKQSVAAVTPGDVLVQGGFPGHAVLVLDMAASASGDSVILLGQSYVPAQEFQVLRNPRDATLSPWYRVSDLDAGLVTPEWLPFTAADLRSFGMW